MADANEKVTDSSQSFRHGDSVVLSTISLNGSVRSIVAGALTNGRYPVQLPNSSDANKTYTIKPENLRATGGRHDLVVMEDPKGENKAMPESLPPVTAMTDAEVRQELTNTWNEREVGHEFPLGALRSVLTYHRNKAKTIYGVELGAISPLDICQAATTNKMTLLLWYGKYATARGTDMNESYVQVTGHWQGDCLLSTACRYGNLAFGGWRRHDGWR